MIRRFLNFEAHPHSHMRPRYVEVRILNKAIKPGRMHAHAKKTEDRYGNSETEPVQDVTAPPQTQPTNEATPEISVAEAARRNREAKAKAAAEEKAKENPPQ